MRSIVLAAVIFVTLQVAQGACRYGCYDHRAALYEALQCKGIKASAFACCPERYDCSHIHNAPEDKCVYSGVLYAKGDVAPVTNASRFHNCNCDPKFGFLCEEKTCPPPVNDPKCKAIYDEGEHCSSGQRCEPAGEKAVTCKEGDKVYEEGEKFNPVDGVCYDCVCAEKSMGSYSIKPLCRRTHCEAELLNQLPLRKNCAPIYDNKDACCPTTWHCPQNKLGEEAKPSGDLETHCRFGNQFLASGTKFKEAGMSCECTVPPFVTCYK